MPTRDMILDALAKAVAQAETPVIQSERLYVRPWKESDLQAFHIIMSDPA
ncbi:MAG: hypothetical protein GY832_28135, partial [Chloroflexi bacterium]|nr:hypothetical protein [Chloroflexota bacterium]